MTHIANLLTAVRILCSIMLLFFPPFSWAFYALYLLCGLTDMIDGTIARKTGSVSPFGETFDTAADIAFTAAALIKILPSVALPKWAAVWIAAIALIKLLGIFAGFVKYRKLTALHTKMNKAVGIMLFFMPLTLHSAAFGYAAAAVCTAATFAAADELRRVISGYVI